MQSSREQQGQKKAFFNEQCNEVEKNNILGKTKDHFKKVRDIKGTFHAKKGMIKDRNCKDLIEEIKKRWQEYTEKGKESEVSQSCLTLCDPMGL